MTVFEPFASFETSQRRWLTWITVYLGMLLGVLVACGTLKDIGRTVTDVGQILCEAYGTEHRGDLEEHARAVGEDPAGLSPADLCIIPAVVDLFNQQAVGAMAGAEMSLSRDDAADTP